MERSAEIRRLAGVTHLSLAGGGGPDQAFVFDPHRLALPCWAAVLGSREPALLVTLDRHFDLVAPADPAAVPDRAEGLHRIDEHARWRLSERNTDHVIAAMEANLVADVVAIARSRPAGAVEAAQWIDRRGVAHRIFRTPTVDRIAADWRTPAATEAAQAIDEAIAAQRPILLDVDLDCFTTPSDADPTAIVPWPRELVREFLLPPGSEPFWAAVRERCIALTLAREPYHCGGLVAGARLFLDVAAVLFGELLGVDLP